MTMSQNLQAAKRWWHSKTVWLGAHLMAASPVLEYAHDNVASLHQIIGKFDAAVSFALGAALVWLRNVTRVPLGKPVTPQTVTTPADKPVATAEPPPP